VAFIARRDPPSNAQAARDTFCGLGVPPRFSVHSSNVGRLWPQIGQGSCRRVDAVAPSLALVRLAGLDRPDAVRPHHLVVFVLDDVAVPDELAGRVELGAPA
jgi:hypothetical protein